MKRIVVVCFVSALLIGLSGCKRSQQPVDTITRFDGDWNVTSMNVKGKQLDAAAAKRFRLNFQEGKYNKYEMTSIKILATDGSTISLDSAKAPAEIDFVRVNGNEAGKVQRGIYSFEDNRLKICVAELGEPRPTDFTPGEKITLMVLERAPQ